MLYVLLPRHFDYVGYFWFVARENVPNSKSSGDDTKLLQKKQQQQKKKKKSFKIM